MKKIILLLTLGLLLTGCGAKPINEDKGTGYYMQDSMNFDFYVDKETCVEYVVFKGGYKGGFTPRLNTDGTLKLNEICLKNLGSVGNYFD